MRFILVQGGIVQFVRDAPESFEPPEGYEAVASDIGEPGDGWVDGAVVPYQPPTPTAPTKPELTAYAASVRYIKETGGVTYQGHPVTTDETSQGKIGNAALGATVVGAAFTTMWKGSDGAFFALDHDGMMAMATAVLTFVNGCYAKEADVAGKIAAGTIKTKAAVDAAFAA